MNIHGRIEDIRKNPEQHKHRDLNELMQCAADDGAISLVLMSAHEGVYGSNGGVGCDVANGPCSCGSWH